MPGIYFHSRKSILNDLLGFIIKAGNMLSKASTLREAITMLMRQQHIPLQYHEKFYHAATYLKRKGYTKSEPFLKPTIKGKQRLTFVKMLDMRLPRSKMWDSKWRLVMFDVPVEKNNNRIAFQEKIKNLGFRMIQRSVWTYPYDCRNEIDQLRSFYKIRNYTTYAVISEIEDEETLRAKFNM